MPMLVETYRGEKPKSPLFFVLCQLFLTLVYVLPAWAQADVHYPLAGMWKTQHPNIEWGDVYICFRPDPDSTAYYVSIWDKNQGKFNKLRDSLQDNFTKAELLVREDRQYIAWIPEDSKNWLFNPVKELSEKTQLILHSDQTDETEIILEYLAEPVPIAGLELSEESFPGTYSYYDPSIGNVSLVISQTGQNDFTLAIVEEIPGAGYAFVREGFYGGLVKDDWLTRAKIADDGKTIIWYRPREKTIRQSRITTLYTDGSIGFSAGDSRLETGLLKRQSENTTIISIDELLPIDGMYIYSEPARNIKTYIHIEKIAVKSGIKYEISSVDEDGSRLPGLFPGDPFDSFEFYHANNSWNIRFFGSSESYTEYLRLLEADTDGYFSIGDNQRKTIASFYKAPCEFSCGEKPETKILVPSLSWDDLTKDEKKLWMMFSSWSRTFAGSWKTKNIIALGFPSINAMLGPEEEFNDFIKASLNPDWYKTTQSRMDQRFPDRYRFLQECLKKRQLEDLLAKNPDQPDWYKWLDPKKVTGLELIITTPASSSVASVAGHLLLLIHIEGESPDLSNSLVAGFVGNTTRDDASNIKAFSFMIRGLTGYYKSLIQVETYSSLCMRANIKENRDVIRFNLMLNGAERERLLERLWTQSLTSSYDYKFFLDNCAGLLLDAIAVAVSNPNLAKDEMVKAPVQVLNKLISANLVDRQLYPSSLSIFNAALEANRAIIKAEKNLLAILPENDAKKIKRIFQTLSGKRNSAIVLDPLFREAYSIPGDALAASSFFEFSEIIITNLEDGSLRGNRRKELLEFSLGFLHHAFKRELYYVMPEATFNPDKLPKYLLEEEADKLAKVIMTRQENSQAIKALRLATSRLRLFAYSEEEGVNAYIIPRLIKEEQAKEKEAKDAFRGIKHGFFPLIIDINIKPAIINPDKAIASEYGLSFGTAFFSADIGDDSFCSLNPKMGLEILKTSGNLYFANNSGVTKLVGTSVHNLLLSFRTTFPFNRLELAEKVQPAFSLVVMDNFYSIWDGISIFSGFSAPSTIAAAKFGLIFTDSLACSNFLALWAGIEYKLSGQFSALDQFFNAISSLESRWKYKSSVFLANAGVSLDFLEYNSWEPVFHFSLGLEADIGKLRSSRISIYYDFRNGLFFRYAL